MRLLKLAFRMALEYRRSLLSTAAAMMLVALVVTAGGSVLASLGEQARAYYRRDQGVYAGVLAPPAYAELQSELSSAGEISAAVTDIGVLSVSDQLILVRTALTDLNQELAYRSIDPLEEVSIQDGVLVGGAQTLSELQGRVVRAETTGTGSEFVRIRAVHAEGSREATLLIHRPEELDSSPVTVRVHRSDGRRAALPEHVPLASTEWRDAADSVLSPLRSRFAFLMAALIVIATAVLLPAQLVLARRTVEVHRLLLLWGFTAKARAAVVYLIGAVIGAVASTAGGVMGMVVISVLNAGGATALELLPFAWRESFALLTHTPATPSIEWAIASIGVSTLLGVVTALPTAPFVATLLSRRSVWN